MKFVISFFFISLIFANNLFANSMGKVVQIEGEIHKISIVSGKRFFINIDSEINQGQKIKVGKKSSVEILLHNGTSVVIKEKSLIYFFSLRMNKNDPPTKIKLEYGKIKIIPKRIFNDAALILTTQTAAISVVDGIFSVIASEYETKVLSYKSKVGVANIHPAIKKAYILLGGEEISIRKKTPPSQPVEVPNYIIKSWFDYHYLSSDNKYIRKITREEGILDWILRKRDF